VAFSADQQAMIESVLDCFNCSEGFVRYDANDEWLGFGSCAYKYIGATEGYRWT